MQYMKKLERKNKLDPISHPRDNSRKGSRTTMDTSQSQVELSTALKIELGRYPFDKRPDAHKCAEVLEEILQAVTEGKTEIKPKRAQPPAFRINKIEKLRKDEEDQEKQTEKLKEDKRKKREREVKEKVRRLKEQRDKETQERMAKIEQAEKDEVERRKQQKLKVKLTKEKKRKKIEDAKKQKEEELIKLQEQEEEEQLKLQAEQKKKNKKFLKQQNQKLKEQFENSKKDREDIESRQLELENKEKTKQKHMKQEMEGYLKKNKDTRKLELNERKEIQKFYRSQEVQDLMQLYDEQLMLIYKYYTLQGNISIGGDLEKKMSVIEFNNWVKFGYFTNITPHLVAPDDMVVIYRCLEREMDASIIKEDYEEINYIEYEHFKKGLIRVAILTKTQCLANEVKHRQRKRKNVKKQQELEEQIEKNKSKNNRLKELEQQIAQVENLQKLKVEDKRISKEFDISLITVDDVERLLKFLQLDPEDDKYTAERKLTNKSGYPKTIVFDGLEGGYSDTHSIRDNSSSHMHRRNASNDEDKYSVIHAPQNKSNNQDLIDEMKEEDDSKDEKKKPKTPSSKASNSEDEKPDAKKELVGVSEDELNAQEDDPGSLENIIDPVGNKEQWQVEQDKEKQNK